MDYVRNETRYGFIMGVKNVDDYEPSVFANVDPDRVIIKPFLPQKTVLDHPKLKVFLTHGGQGSFIDAIYGRTALLVYPLVPTDAQFTCEYVHLAKLGRCLRSTQPEEIRKNVDIAEANDYYYSYLDSKSHFVKEHTKNVHDFSYWVDYVFTIGTDHLRPSYYDDLPFYARFDLDIDFILSLAFLLILYTCCKCTACCFRRCCRTK